MPKKVFVTGIGIISSIGLDQFSVFESIKQMKSGIGKNTLIDSIYKDEIPVAEIKLKNDELAGLALLKKRESVSRTTLLGLIAARQALKDAHLEGNGKQLRTTGIISATSVGGMDKSENFYREFIRDKNKGHLSDVITHDCGESTERIASEIGIDGYASTISTACSSSANSIMMGVRLIRQGIIERAVVGGTDSLTLFTINGFNSLMILDREQCKPFDENRNGLNLGEGAGFLVIESEEIVNRDNKKFYCEVSGFGNACDAYHQTASSPEGNGAYLSMKKAVESANLKTENIDYVNAHGTGTKNNDLSEGKAMERLFGKNIPAFSSTKSFTGHTLAAAGAIEAVLSVIAIQNQCIYPNLNFKTPVKELGFFPVTSLLLNTRVNHIMSNSFGFGGNNSTLIFSKC